MTKTTCICGETFTIKKKFKKLQRKASAYMPKEKNRFIVKLKAEKEGGGGGEGYRLIAPA